MGGQESTNQVPRRDDLGQAFSWLLLGQRTSASSVVGENAKTPYSGQ